MNIIDLSENIWLILTTLFDFLAIFLLIQKTRSNKLMAQREKTQQQKVYQISVLKEIQDRISYSLDIEEIVDIIIGSLKHLFSYSTASSLILRNDKVIFKTYVEERVSPRFIQSVKDGIIDSFTAITGQSFSEVTEEMTGAPLDETNTSPLASFFHIPLIVNNKVVGIINVSSVKPNLYKEEEMTILYQIVSQASNAVTKLKEVLETEKGKLTAMISGLADGVFMVDNKKDLMIINEAAKAFLNIDKQNCTFFDILSSLKGQYDIVSKIDEALTSGNSITEKEVMIGDKSLQVFITPVIKENETGKVVIGASILLHDFTIEKKLSNIKEDFTHMVVHEIRAPLTAIKASSELILEGGAEIDKAQEKQMLEIIRQQSKVLLEQIGSILDAAKIEAKSFSVNKELGDIKQVIEDAVTAQTPVASKKKILLIRHLDEHLPRLEFDHIRIGQTINNLISNSLKFTQEGGTITISANIDHNSIKVSVSDNGIGIPQDEINDLFSKYYQIRKTPRELAKKGTGLGLYIVKGIIESHEGKVWAESEEGKGTTISFTLPVKVGQQPKQAEPEAKEQAAPPLSPTTGMILN
ncbi:ATP-binding protein [Patescibacteria group bacterium]|nr:ATP-binding protein [Patescibacteria group bacterium]